MGLKVKIDGVEQKTNTTPDPIQMNQEMTERLWEVINENTELKQQLFMAESKLEQIKRLLG